MKRAHRVGASIILYFAFAAAITTLVVVAVALPSLMNNTAGLPGTVTPSSTPVPTTPAPPLIVEISGTATPPPPMGQPGPWALTFRDEFDGQSLDTGRWTSCYPWYDPTQGCTNAGNQELQWYLPQEVSVADGILSLTAEENTYTGLDGQTYTYTSGMIASGSRLPVTTGYSFQYGYVEAAMKVPAGKGLWPAFWLAPADGSWPPEVDIAEHVGGGNPTKISMVVHFAVQYGHLSDITEYVGPNFATDWHVFGLDWQPDSLTWYIDGVPRKQYTNIQNIPHQPMYLVFTLAILGSRAPEPNAPFPQVLQVSYVRVWQRPSGQ